jgi:glycosyltransferase involved in cell wall biosynthesis
VRIAAFTKYDRDAASTRQRVLQYLPALEAAGFEVSHHPLLGNDYVRSLAGGPPAAPGPIVASYLKRFMQLVAGPECDLIWVYAEAFPYLPAWFERLLIRSGKPVIYDFDDAFFVPYDEHPDYWVRRMLAGKLEPLIAGADAVCCGNDYLLDYARRLNPHSMLLPTVVDTDIYQPVAKRDGQTVIGWIGSPSTWNEVRPILPVVAELCRQQRLRFRVVGAGAAAQADQFEGMELVEWSEAREVAEVQAFDIGIMPLRDLPFQRGKSGYKIVQYMACGLPVVAAPVGVNTAMVDQGAIGFLAVTQREWADALTTLVDDVSLRKRMGAAGRDKAVLHYSLHAHAPRLVELFQSLGGQA